MTTKLSRRTILGGVAASAAAGVLAACGGEAATTAPAPTVAAATTAATRAATAAATTGAAAPASTPATVASTSGTAAAAPTTAATAGGIAGGSVGTGAGPTPNAAAVKGKTLTFFQKTQYYRAVQDGINAEVTNFVKAGGGNIEIALQSDQGAQNLQKIQAGVDTNMGFDLVDSIGSSVQQNVTLNLNLDVTDLVDEFTKSYGTLMPIVTKGLSKNGKFYAVPWFTSSDVWFLRKDKLDAKGIKPDSLKTYDQFRDAALAISDPSAKFFGWGNSPYPTGDGTTLVFHVIHNWGGAITNKEGNKVVFNSPETVAGVSWLADIYQNPKYKPMLPPGWESWNDSANNEAYLNGSVGFTANAFTLYAKARDDKNPVFGQTYTAPRPTGPAAPQGLRGGQLGYLYITRTAQNVPAAKEIIRRLVQPDVWNKLAQQGGGLFLPAYESQWKGDFWKSDPNYAPLETQVRDANGYNQIFYPADANPGTDAVGSQNVLIDMMASILQKGLKPADAVKEAHDRMVKIFEQFGIKQ